MARNILAKVAIVTSISIAFTPVASVSAFAQQSEHGNDLATEVVRRVYPVVPLALSALYLNKGGSKFGKEAATILVLASTFAAGNELTKLARDTALATTPAIADAASAVVLFIPAAGMQYFGKNPSNAWSTIGTMTLASASNSVGKSLKALINDNNWFGNHPQYSTQAVVMLSAGLVGAAAALKGGYLNGRMSTSIALAGGITSIYLAREAAVQQIEKFQIAGIVPESVVAFLFTSAGIVAASFTRPGPDSPYRALEHTEATRAMVMTTSIYSFVGLANGVLAETLVEAGAYTAISPVVNSFDKILNHFGVSESARYWIETGLPLVLASALSVMATPAVREILIIKADKRAYAESGSVEEVNHRFFKAVSTALLLPAAFAVVDLIKNHAAAFSFSKGSEKKEL